MLELTENKDHFPLEGLADRLYCKPILLVEATQDCHTPPEYHSKPLKDAILKFDSNKLAISEFETDHFASACRPVLCDKVTAFLSGLSEV